MKKLIFALLGVAMLTLTSCQPKKTVVAHTPYRTIVTYDITFDVNKADITEQSMAEINRIKTLMDQNPALKYEVPIRNSARSVHRPLSTNLSNWVLTRAVLLL